jgi:phosphoglycolate phosphatase-like HAD superfamily hydrolase
MRVNGLPGRYKMAMDLQGFEKRKEFLVCIDSDGCAIDSMNIKHINCFGPRMVDEWGLQQWAGEILESWNYVNLYSMTRGINRFKGLLLALSEINEKYTEIEDLGSFAAWVETTGELSNGSLSREIEANPDSICLRKALSWSNAVNESIKKLPEEEVLPFGMVKEALMLAHERADVAIVSSANLGAIMDEWERHELLPHVDLVLAQNAGTKAYCIEQLLKKGYDPTKVVMCGDAPGDMDAAKVNGVLYYPIKVNLERESWTEFIELGFGKLLDGSYSGEYQSEKINEFINNLSK